MIYCVEFQAHNGVSVETHYVSSHPFVTESVDTPANVAFEVRLLDPITIKLSAYDKAMSYGGSSVGGGEIVISNPDRFYDGLVGYGFDGRSVIVRVGEETSAYPSGFTTVLDGTMEAPKWDRTRLTLRVRDKQELFNKPLLTATYAGTNSLPNGLEGVVGDIKGQVKPRVYGQVFNIQPVFVNTSRLIYQVSDGVVSSVDAVYDRGVSLTKGADYVSQVDMETNAPLAGNFRAWSGGGYFRLGSSAVGIITTDVTQGSAASNRTVGQILSSICASMGGTANSTDVSDLDTANNSVVGVYINSDTNANEVMDEVAASIGAWYSFDGTGELRLGQLSAPTTTEVFTVDEATISKLDLLSIADTDTGVPAYRWTLNYKKFYVTQDSDLAGSVTDARRSELSKEYRTSVAEDASVKTQFLLAEDITENTLLVTEAAAATESSRRLALHKVRRDRVVVRVKLDEDLLTSIRLMSVVKVVANFMNYSSGKKFRLLGYTVEPRSMMADLILWG